MELRGKKRYLLFFGFAAISHVLLFVAACGHKNSTQYSYIPTELWPGFDKQAPYLINGVLWVGFDEDEQEWKYLKIPFAEKAGEVQRGLSDPGDPSSWKDAEGVSGVFSCVLNDLPSGTHINNRYNPGSPAYRFKVDDYMVKVGNFWVDKYESSVIIVESENNTKWIDDPENGGIGQGGSSKSGTGFSMPPQAIAVSQRHKGSSGFSYFAAEQAALNSGKHILRNEQWQAASAGTARTNAEGMEPGGETWNVVNDQDISRFGIVGCAGSLWEWTSSWGQYGEHYTGAPTNWYDWPGPASYAEWDGKYDTYGNDIVINVAGRAFTRQDSARYAQGLPAALVRGGSWGDHNRAGIFALIADGAPSYYGFEVGFRCVK